MKDVIKALEDQYLLTQEDLLAMRQDIYGKHREEDTKERAKMLSMAIHGALDEGLTLFNEGDRLRVKRGLIKKFIVEGKEGITKGDVLHVSQRLQGASDIFIKDLSQWLEHHIDHPLEIPSLLEELTNWLSMAEEKDGTLPIETDSHEDSIKKKTLDHKASHSLQKNNRLDSDLHDTSKPIKLTFILGILFIGIMMVGALGSIKKHQERRQAILEENNVALADSLPRVRMDIPEFLRYKEIDEGALKAYLDGRQALLGQPPYFDTMLQTAREFGINPLVLFSIAGHEQGFVPKNHVDALEMVNNPFNVFGSWLQYNTNLKDTSEIAARTLINLIKDKPDDIDPFQWINRKYAEDKKWWIGVRKIYNHLERIAGDPEV